MGLHGKLMVAIEFKKGGDLFHDLFTNKPHHLSKIVPEKLQGCDLIEGEFGKVGSIISWKFSHGGKEKSTKDLIQAMNPEEKSIELKVLEGDVLKEYKDFLLKMHVETKGEVDLVAWTIEFETLSDETGYPFSWLEYLIQLTKGADAHLPYNP